MSEEKIPCRECGHVILVATAKRTGGVCMPCKRKASPPVAFEITPDHERRFQAIDAIVDRLLHAPSKEELLAARCPVCASPLELSLHHRKRTFFLRCATSSMHLGTHRVAEALPPWMDEYVSDGWFEEGSSQAPFGRRGSS